MKILIGVKSTLLLLFFVSIFSSGYAQEQTPVKRPLTLSIFNTGTQLPGSLFTLPVHPGLSAGTAFRYNRSEKNELYQTVCGPIFTNLEKPWWMPSCNLDPV
jgi:hypothetical protein